MITRRAVLAGAAAMSSSVVLQAALARQQQDVRPRSDWGGDLPPVGPLEAEAPGDVRFLLVHHTAGPNEYTATDVPGILRGIYEFHTTQKGWPDVAYNFFVDRFGGVWEGRAGSLAGPVKGDATGGNQGFAQLCCLLGTFTDVPPTPEAHAALVGLLARLADSYGIDTAPGATTTFVSRGSNRWPAGANVTATTIAGHRDMSQTACPGDACYAMVADGTFAREVTERRGGAVATTTTAVAPTTSTAVAPTTAVATSTTEAAAGTTTAVAPTDETRRSSGVVAAAAGAALVVAAGLVALRRRRT